MAITFPVSFPANPIPSQISFEPFDAVGFMASPFTGTQQVQVQSGQWWLCNISYSLLERADAETVAAFLTSLRGMFGTFTMGDASAAAPRGTAATSPGTPVVNGGSQTGDQLIIDGAPNTESGWLLPGDYIQLSSGASAKLHKVLSQADSDGSGNVTLDIWPSLRVSPADNDAVVVNSAVGVWRLLSNKRRWTAETVLFNTGFQAIEAL